MAFFSRVAGEQLGSHYRSLLALPGLLLLSEACQPAPQPPAPNTNAPPATAVELSATPPQATPLPSAATPPASAPTPPAQSPPQLSAQALVMSDSHACVVNRDGTVWCWGSSLDNSVGTGRNKPAEDFATRVPGVSQAVRIAADTHLSCAVLREGRLQCWGLTDHIVGSEHGDPTDAPVTSPAIADALDVSSTANEVCLLRRDGTVRMWESTISLHYFVMKKTPPGFCQGCVLDGLRDAIQVSSGGTTHCALLRSGTLRCWGGNETGQYGNGVFTPTPSGTIPPRKPVEVPGLKNVQQIAVSGHVCALLKDGTLRCWGANNLAQTGVPGVNPLTKPTAVPGLAGVAQVAVGADHTCARMSDATVRCWGSNDRGQLGDGTTTHRTTPVAVSSLNSVVSIAAGGGGSCAIRTDGSVWCWGQVMTLGDGSSTFRPTPGQVKVAIPK